MDTLTLADMAGKLGCNADYPNYDGPTITRLLALADRLKDDESFGLALRKRLAVLPQTDVWCVGERPVGVNSHVLGPVSWLEDFTLFAVHPGFDWGVHFADVVDFVQYDFSVCLFPYKSAHPDRARKRVAHTYDPRLPLASKKRQDIQRAYRDAGSLEVTHTSQSLPPLDCLARGVRRWDMMSLTGTFFLWQWLWVAAAGRTTYVRSDAGEAWVGMVTYRDFNVFTAFYTTGGSGLGTVALHEAIQALPGDRETLLTIPLTPEVARDNNPDKYETYKRKMANGTRTILNFACRCGLTEKPYPPYLDSVTGKLVEE